MNVSERIKAIQNGEVVRSHPKGVVTGFIYYKAIENVIRAYGDSACTTLRLNPEPKVDGRFFDETYECTVVERPKVSIEEAIANFGCQAAHVKTFYEALKREFGK